MSTTVHPITAEQLFVMPRDAICRELVRGAIKTMNPSGFEHGAVVGELHWRIAQFVRLHRLGVVVGAETGFLLERDPDTVLAPDIGFVSQARIDAGGIPKSFYPGAPDLVIEVQSPSESTNSALDKVQRWLRLGARVAVTVEVKQRTFSAYRPPFDEVVFQSHETFECPDVLPGFSCRIEEAFTALG